MKLCGFHYAQSLQRRLRTLNLGPLYDRAPAHGFDNPPYRAFHSFVRKLVALMLIPENYVRVAFQRMYSQGPAMNDPNLDQRIAEFVDYYSGTWMTTDTHISYWNHNGHSGPRTNNYCEGFNNGLHSKIPVHSYIRFLGLHKKTNTFFSMNAHD